MTDSSSLLLKTQFLQFLRAIDAVYRLNGFRGPGRKKLDTLRYSLAVGYWIADSQLCSVRTKYLHCLKIVFRVQLLAFDSEMHSQRENYK